jgi:hypothetical protein
MSFFWASQTRCKEELLIDDIALVSDPERTGCMAVSLARSLLGQAAQLVGEPDRQAALLQHVIPPACSLGPTLCACPRLQMRVTTVLGAFLDPVADKIMVSTVLVLLSVSPPEPLSHKDLAIPVVIMIGREITMSALREWAAASGGGAHKVGSRV